jgi:hypothetical protein
LVAVVAVAFVGMAVLTIIRTFPLGPADGVDRVVAQQTTKQAEGNQRAPYRSAPSASPDQEKAQTYDHPPNCEKPKSYSEADLCQQRRVADAAERQNNINLGTLGLLAATLLATVIAAYAAWQTVRTMRDNAQKELRAYIFVERASITDVRKPDGYQVSILSKNFGKTPAKDYTHIIGIGPGAYPPPTPFPVSVPKPDRPAQTSFPPDGQFGRTHSMLGLTPAEIARFNAGTLAIYVVGEMSYTDAFGEARKTWYRLYHRINKDEAGRLTADKEGSGYT